MPATIPRERSIHAEIEVGRPDGETWVPIKDYVSSITVEQGDVSAIGTGQSGVDGVVRRLNFSIHNDRSLPVRVWPKDGTVPRSRTLNEADTVPAAGTNSEWLIRLLGQTPSIKGESFAPRDRTSGWNYFEGDYEPLLWPTREVTFRATAKVLSESPDSSDWVTLFHGFMGDSIQSEGSAINCSLRDYSKMLQDYYVEKNYSNPKIYGSDSGTPVEDELQRLLDDELGEGVVTLYFPSGTEENPRPISESPGFMLKPYEVGEKSLWDELQTIVAVFGWFIGYRWHEPTQNMQLVLMEPPRDKHSGTADFHFTASEIYIHDLDITDRDVRNSVSVDWRDPITGQLKTVTVEDQDSIDRFGRRHMHIGESDTIVLKSEEEALRLANAALHDLKDLTGVVRLTLPFIPELDVFAGITVSDPRMSSTVDFYGVESVRHILDFDNGQFRTEAVCSTRVVGGKRKWLRMQARPGQKPSIPPESVGSGSATMPEPTGIEWESIPGGITIYVPKPPVHSLRWSLTEVHISDTNGFVPDDTTLVASNRATEFTIAPLEGGQTVYIRAAYVDVDGRRHAFSEQVQGETGEVDPIDLTPPATPTGLTADFTGPDLYLSWAPVDRAVRYRVRISDANGVRRERHVSGSSYTYTLADNRADGSPAQPSLTVQVWAQTREGVYSETPAVITAVNDPPAMPTATAESSLTQLRWRITSDLPSDLRHVKITADSYTITSPAANGVMDLRDAGIADSATAALSFVLIDVFGQESDPYETNVQGHYVSESDLAGEIFEVVYHSEQFPAGADPAVLYDNDPTTGIVFTQAPTITIKHPQEERFGILHLHVDQDVDGYVQIRRANAEDWEDVIGSPSNPYEFKAGENTVAFSQMRIKLAQEVRVVLLSPVGVYECVPQVYLIANHILGGTLQLTQNLRIENEDGSLIADATGIKTVDPETGDYSKLEAGVLAFYKAGYDKPHVYTKRIARGTTPSGYFVSLEHGRLYAPGEDIDDPTQGIDITEHPDYDGVDAIPWDRDPKVLPSISRLVTYNDAYDSPQMVEARVEVLGTKGFWVYATHNSGGMDREVEQQPGSSSRVLQNGQTWISSISRKNVNRLQVGVVGQGDQLGPFAWKHQYDIRLAYKREDQVEWTQFWRMARHDDFWFQGDMYQIYYWASVEVPPHPDYGYQIRLSIHNIDGGIRSAAQINSWMSYITKEIPSDLNAVSWIAIEGG